MHLQENTLFDLDPGHTKHRPVPSISCDLSFMHLQSLKLLRPTNYKKRDGGTGDGPTLVRN